MTALAWIFLLLTIHFFVAFVLACHVLFGQNITRVYARNLLPLIVVFMIIWELSMPLLLISDFFLYIAKRKRAKIIFWEECDGELKPISEYIYKCTKCREHWMDVSIRGAMKCPAPKPTKAGEDFNKSFWGRLLAYFQL